MKFLADLGVSMTTARALREDGHEVIHLREEGLGRLSDAAILEKARKEKCVVLTFDLDFGDLLATTIQSLPSVIIFPAEKSNPDMGYTKITGNHIKLQTRTCNRRHRDG